MAIKAETLGEPGILVANITLFSVLIYELVGPFLTKIALTKVGEIKPHEKVSAREQAKKRHCIKQQPTEFRRLFSLYIGFIVC